MENEIINKGRFTKGFTPWNKGKKGLQVGWCKKGFRLGHEVTEETRRKISIGKKSNPISVMKSKLQAIRMHEIIRGSKQTPESNLKRSLAMKGRTFTRNGKPMAGDNHPAWKGGISFEIYPKEFNSELKLKIRKRDNFTCCLCAKSEEEELEEYGRVLCINHIDFNKKNCQENNLNTLCFRCNLRVNHDRPRWTYFFQTQLQMCQLRT